MKEQFVPHEIAIKLNEKGFDWNCLAVYMNGEFQIPRGFGMAIVTKEHVDVLKGKAVLAPLWQQVIDWLSDVHNIEVDAMRYTYRGGVYQGKCYMWFVDQYDPKYNHELEEDDSHWILNERKAQGYDFKTKREAILAGITEALTLI